MITKKEGAEDSCPSCRQLLVCRTTQYKDNPPKLQWQYKDREEAHFSFDFKTQKSACKESSDGPKASTNNTSATKEINLDSLIHLTKEEQGKIIEDTEKVGESLACQLKAIDNLVAKGVISDKYDRGMIFNAVVQYRVH